MDEQATEEIPQGSILQKNKDPASKVTRDLIDNINPQYQNGSSQSSASSAQNTTNNNYQKQKDTMNEQHTPDTEEQDADDIPTLKGELKLDTVVKNGYSIFLIAGISHSGKTQIIRSFYNTEQQGLDVGFDCFRIRVGATPPGQINIYPVAKDLAGGKAAVVDTSGEYFKTLYRNYNRRNQGSGGDFDMLDIQSLRILRRLANALSGVILVIDLQTLWAPFDRFYPERREQMQIA
ncbi:hypothetical protein TI03_06175, partial [Achromatium sp. WMS1]